MTKTHLIIVSIKSSFGFNQDELNELLGYAKTNAFLIWDIARENMKRDEAKDKNDTRKRLEIARSLYGIIPADITLEEARAERLGKI